MTDRKFTKARRAIVPQRGRMRRHRAVFTFLILMLAASSLAACQDEENAATDTPPRPIVWSKVSAHEPTTTRTLPGRLRAAQRAPLSFKVAGQLAAVDADTGDRFEEGEVLATIDKGPFQLALNERQGELEQAEAALIETEGAFKRSKTLLAKGVASQATFDRAARALESSRKQIKTAEACLAMAKDDLSDTVLRAPYAGYVAERKVEPSSVSPPEKPSSTYRAPAAVWRSLYRFPKRSSIGWRSAPNIRSPFRRVPT